MRKFLFSTLLLVAFFATLAFAADSLAVSGNGVVGDLFINFIQSIIPGAGLGVALTIWSAVVLVIVRVAQFGFSKMPTVQRNLAERIFWMIIPILLGKRVKEENYQPEDPVEEVSIKQDLKKRFPILRTEIS